MSHGLDHASISGRDFRANHDGSERGVRVNVDGRNHGYVIGKGEEIKTKGRSDNENFLNAIFDFRYLVTELRPLCFQKNT